MAKSNVTKPKTKIPYKSALANVELGIITEEQLNEMIDAGIVASTSPTRGNGRLVMVGSDKKTQIEPTLYFKGSTGLNYTKEMNELRDKFNKLKSEYCQRTTEVKVAA